MDKRLNTYTSNENDFYKVSFLETHGNVKPSFNQKKVILIGAWTCALLVTSHLSSVNNQNVYTTLTYPNKRTQSNVLYTPITGLEDLPLGEEIDNNVFVKTMPESSQQVRLVVKAHNEGRPIIDKIYES